MVVVVFDFGQMGSWEPPGRDPDRGFDERSRRLALLIVRAATVLWGACAVAAWAYSLPGVVVALFALVTVLCGVFWVWVSWDLPA